MKINRPFTTEVTIALLVLFAVVQSLGVILLFILTPGRTTEEMPEQLPYILLYQGVFLILTILTIIFYFNRRIKKPISDISAAIGEIKVGSLAVMRHTGCAEVVTLIDAINSLVGRLKETIRKLFSTARDVTIAIGQTEMIINNILKTTNNQLASAEEIISSLKNADKSKKSILDSTHSLAEFSEENVSSLAQINSTVDEITESTEQLLQSSTSIYSTIVEVSEAAKNIAKSMENLSVSTEYTSTAVDELTATLKEIEKSTKNSADLTSRVRKISSERGMLSVADAMEGMETISESVSKSLELVKCLEIKSRDIEKILSVIGDITKQTNLLSLNAAILSSQAGEHGKGFSVVADEIKVLADKTVSSTKDITNIIKATQTDIISTLSVAEENLKIVEKGTSLVVKTGEAFREVIDIARKSAELAKVIQKATEEQVIGVAEVNKSMEMINSSVEDATKATYKQEQGAKYILGIAEQIKDISALLKKGMEEQSAGIRMISKNIELTNEKIKYIDNAVSEQERADEEFLLSVDNITSVSKNNLDSIREVVTSLNTLRQKAEALIEDIEGFKLG